MSEAVTEHLRHDSAERRRATYQDVLSYPTSPVGSGSGCLSFPTRRTPRSLLCSSRPGTRRRMSGSVVHSIMNR